MAVSLKHKFQSAKADGGDDTVVRPSNWNDEHDLTLGTGKLLGRTTAGAGTAEEITVGAGLSLSAGSLSATALSDVDVKEYVFTVETATTPSSPTVEVVMGTIPVTTGKTVAYQVHFVVTSTSGTGQTAGYIQLSGLARNTSGTVADVGTLHEVVVYNGGSGITGVDCRATSSPTPGVDVWVYHEIAESRGLRWRAYVRTVEAQ